jgi:hypothetical protein
MYSKATVIPGIILFLVIVLFPLWYNSVTGKAGSAPDLKIGTDAKQCVESTAYMKASHMDLLSTWKETVVREGIRLYRAKDGKDYTISLTGTCIKCHSDKEAFCDSCHNYTGVKPYCWDCHNYPKVAGK